MGRTLLSLSLMDDIDSHLLSKLSTRSPVPRPLPSSPYECLPTARLELTTALGQIGPQMQQSSPHVEHERLRRRGILPGYTCPSTKCTAQSHLCSISIRAHC